jgi:zinc protease
MLWNTVPVFAPGDAELDMVANILGQGKSSRLFQRLVYDRRIAESVTVHHGSRVLGGAFEIAYTAMPGHTLAEIEKAIDEELDKIRTTAPTAEEVERARNQLKTQVFRSMERLSGLASRLLYYDVFAGDPGYLRRDLDRYDQATPEDLRTWAKKILAKNARVVTSVEPNPQAPIMGRLLSPPSPSKPLVAAPAAANKPSSAPATAKKAATAGKPAAAGKAATEGKPAAATSVAVRATPDAPFRDKLPPPRETRPFKVPPVKRLRLRNGLAVILAESHKLPLVSVDMVVKTGGGANPKDRPGLASLTANLLDEGTTKRSATDIANQIAQLGATLVTYASWDASAVSLATLAENLDRAAPVWADVLLHPNFSQTELERVVDNVIAALAKRKDSPPIVARHVYSRALWGDGHPFAWPNLGTESSLKKTTRADVKRFYDTYFAPNNAVLVVSGDITEKELRAKLEPLLAAWRPRKVPTVKVPKVEAPAKPRIVIVDKPGAPQSSLRIGLPAIQRKNPDYYRALVTNNILGGTFKRLTMNLRETKGWTYGVSSQFDARRTPGPWTVAGEFVAAHTADAVAEIEKEIQKLRTDPVSDQELADTKDEIAGAFPARFATAEQLASQMAALAVYGLPGNELDSFVTKIRGVSKEDVRKTAQKYLRPEHLLIVVVGDRASLEPSLRKLAEVERRDLDGNLLEPGK